jgi:hypothetical protein
MFGTTGRWWRRFFYFGVLLTALGTLKPYVLPILTEANGELGTSFDIDNVMRFVVLPGLMGIALVFDRLIFLLMMLIVGSFGYAISQGSCTEPDLVKGVIRCGWIGVDHVKATALDLFQRGAEIRAAFSHLGDAADSYWGVIKYAILILVLLAFVWTVLGRPLLESWMDRSSKAINESFPPST